MVYNCVLTQQVPIHRHTDNRWNISTLWGLELYAKFMVRVWAKFNFAFIGRYFNNAKGIQEIDLHFNSVNDLCGLWHKSPLTGYYIDTGLPIGTWWPWAAQSSRSAHGGSWKWSYYNKVLAHRSIPFSKN